MRTAPPPDTHEIVIAATLWLMHRHRQTGCSQLARLIVQHLRWMQAGARHPALARACARLSLEWRAASCAARPAIPHATLH